MELGEGGTKVYRQVAKHNRTDGGWYSLQQSACPNADWFIDHPKCVGQATISGRTIHLGEKKPKVGKVVCVGGVGVDRTFVQALYLVEHRR